MEQEAEQVKEVSERKHRRTAAEERERERDAAAAVSLLTNNVKPLEKQWRFLTVRTEAVNHTGPNIIPMIRIRADGSEDPHPKQRLKGLN